MGAKKKKFTMTDEQSSVLTNLYQDNRRLFYTLAKKYAHNTEAIHDLIQDALIYIATALQADYAQRTQDYRSLIYFAFKSIYKDRSVNTKNLDIYYGDIADDTYDEAGCIRPDTYASPVVSPEECEIREHGEIDLHMLIDSISKDDTDRVIIEYIVEEGLMGTEIAERLGRSKQFVDYRLQKIRKRAASFLKKSTFLRTHADK